MKFQDMISMLSEHVKEQIALEHQQTDRQLSFLTERAYLRSCWESMSPDEKQVMEYFILTKGEDFLTYREIEQGTLPLHPTRFRLAMVRLQRLGLLFSLRRMWGEMAYIMPAEIVHHFRHILVPKSPTWTRQAWPLDHTSYHILDDLLQVLNCVKRKSLELTKKGTLTKKTLKQLFEHTQMTKERFVGFPPLSMLAPYDLHEAIVLELLVHLGLIVKKGNLLLLGQAEKWIHQGSETLSQQLLEQLLGYLDLNPKLAHFYSLIQELDKGHSYSVHTILQDMKGFAPPLEEVSERLILPLSRLGFMQMEVKEDDLIFLWKNREELPRPFVYIQPNFEILMPGFAPLSLKWELLSYTDLIKQEEMWVFQLNKQAAQVSFEKGNSAEDLLAFLRSISQVPIPENVEASIRAWEGQMQQVSFMDARVMKISHAELAQELERIPSIFRYFREKLGERAYMIDVKDWEFLVQELEKRGYPTGEVQNLLDPAPEEDDESISFFKMPPTGGEYKVESIFPDMQDAIPELRQIPKMWVSHYSRYHESNLREIVQWAVRLGLEVRLDWKGKEYRMQPLSLVNRHGYWTVVTRESEQKEQSFRLAEIDKIQLLMPSHIGKC